MVIFQSKLSTFWHLPSRTKELFLKAVIISAIVKITLVFLPFKIVLKWLGKQNVESETSSDPNSEDLRAEVKKGFVIMRKIYILEN